VNLPSEVYEVLLVRPEQLEPDLFPEFTEPFLELGFEFEQLMII
jgi:hypothetical protein